MYSYMSCSYEYSTLTVCTGICRAFALLIVSLMYVVCPREHTRSKGVGVSGSGLGSAPSARAGRARQGARAAARPRSRPTARTRTWARSAPDTRAPCPACARTAARRPPDPPGSAAYAIRDYEYSHTRTLLTDA